MTERAPRKRRSRRRTPEELIAFHQERIAGIKARAATKEARADPAARTLIAAARALDKAIAVATEHHAEELVRALESSRAPLSEVLVARGVRLRDRKSRRPRKPRRAPAA